MSAERGSDLYLSYVVSHEAWYWQHLGQRDEQIIVSDASTGGGVAWEFVVEQVSNIGVQVQIFHDAWQAFDQCPELFAALAELGEGATLNDVREVLDRLGFKDRTDRGVPAWYGADQ